ncbi:DUF4126 family protein [Inquilinus sp. KBS0705]|nr:DUF4126 family protein [Inquilinus sp. KBS0705]
MKSSATNPFTQAAGLGLIAGMRTFIAPAVISHMYSRHPSKKLRKSKLDFLQTITTSKIFKVLAAGELIGDKLPTAPNRTAAPGLIGRALSGAVAGAAVYRVAGKNMVVGSLIGSAAAVASTFGCFFLRKALAKTKIIPDALVGGIEDALAISAGIAIARTV